MKNVKIYILLALTVLAAACSEDDKETVIIQDTIERGAILRTVSVVNASFDIFNPDSAWEVIIEAQDVEDGALLSSVDVYLDYVDLTPEDGETATDEVTYDNIPASAFSIGPNGFPRTPYSITFTEALNALGLDESDYSGGDQVNIRMQLNLTDGRSFSAASAGATVSGGTFFLSPFNYRAALVCPPKAGPAGTWTIEMQDAYGDGWNGASLTVTIDGTSTDYLVTEAQGTSNTETFEVPDGAESLSIIYNSGDWDVEVSFQITSATDTELINIGPPPPADVELLDYCAPF